jgi:hypothetical protein
MRKIKRIKRFIEWKAIPFVVDVIKYGLIGFGLIIGATLPAIFGLLAFNYFGMIYGVIVLIICIGIIATIVERSV